MDVDDPPEFSATDSGLKYRILRNSDGEKPTAASTRDCQLSRLAQ